MRRRFAVSSRHPYAVALVVEAERRLGAVMPATGVEETPGEGLARTTAEGEDRLGSAAWCGVEGDAGVGAEVWFRKGDQAPVRFRFADAMRPDAAETVAALKRRGFAVALLSGDRTGAVERAAREAGIETWGAELKPADKIAWLEARAKEGRKALMAGDGLNDAPALATAHASISPATAADLSQRAADFVFQGVKLAPVAEAISTGRRAHAMAMQNFAVAGPLQHHLRAARDGRFRYAAHRRHRDVELLDPGDSQCGAIGGEGAAMTALAWLIPAALVLGALGLGAFLWALRSGQFDDMEGAAYRALEDDPPDDEIT